MGCVEVVFLVGGSIMTLLGLYSAFSIPKAFLEDRRDDRMAKRTMAEVIRVVEEPARGPDSSPTSHAVFRFEDEEGRRHTIKSRFGSFNLTRYKVGDSVAVAWPPGKPQEARLDSFLTGYQGFLTACVFAAVFLGIGPSLVLVIVMDVVS